MKTKITQFIVGFILSFAVLVTIRTTFTHLSSYQIKDGTEVLTDNELPPAVITCSSGNTGSCFIVYDAGSFITYYACKYTGSPSDFCNWLNIIAKDLITILF